MKKMIKMIKKMFKKIVNKIEQLILTLNGYK
jgi:hypothetical protein